MQGFDEVEVILQFDLNSQLNVSGLLRQNGGLDKSLDQETVLSSVRTFTKLPGDNDEWFHTDFQVAYDPCTCLYDSRLQLKFTPITSNGINLTNVDFSSLDIDLLDADGLNQASAIIPIAPRMITFHSMAENLEYARVMSEKCIERMLANGNNTDWLNFMYSSLALLETLAHAETNIIGGIEITEAALHAVDIRSQWGLPTSSVSDDFENDIAATWGILPAACWTFNPSDYHYTVDLKKVMEFCAMNMPGAQSFSSSAITESTNQNKFSVIPSSAYLSSQISLQNDPPGTTEIVQLLNPGTYPIQESDGNFEVNAQNYPVFNEVLGLFAVLEEPKLDIFHKVEIVEGAPWVNTYCNMSPSCDCQGPNGTIQGPFVTERITSSVNTNTYRFKLSEPLKIVYNPILNIEASEVKVTASLTLWGSTNDHAPDPVIVCTPAGTNQQEPGTFQCGPNYPSGVSHWIEISPTISGFAYSTAKDNLHESELLNTYNTGDRTIKSFSYSSNYCELDNFNTQIFELNTTTSQVWRDYSKDWTQLEEQNPTGWSCWWQTPDNGYCGDYPHEVINAIIDMKQSNTNREITFQSPYTQGALTEASLGFIDLLFEIPIRQNANRTSIVFQHVRYPLNFEYQNQVNNEFTVGWSATANPNPIGSDGLQQYVYYGEKNWTISDMASTGGEFLSPPNSSPVIEPSAITFIEILGNQAKANDVNEVIFKSENSISVHGNVIIPLGFTLKLEDLIEETYSPTPLVSPTELEDFCASIGGNSYHANQRAFTIVEDKSSAQPSQMDKSKYDSFLLYPNPVSDILSIRLAGFSELQQVDILNTVSAVVQSISTNTFTAPNLVNVDISALASGAYYIRCSYSNGISQQKSFVVFH